MSDATLSTARRAALANPAERAAYLARYARLHSPADVLRERVRVGDLRAERVELAARLSHPVAREVHPHVSLIDWASWSERREALRPLVESDRRLVVSWLTDGAERALGHAEGVLPVYESRQPGDSHPRRAIEAGRDLCAVLRRWLRGEATDGDVREARRSASTSAADPFASYADDRDAASYAAASATYATYAAYAVADAFAYTAAATASYAAASATNGADSAYANAVASAAYADASASTSAASAASAATYAAYAAYAAYAYTDTTANAATAADSASASDSATSAAATAADSAATYATYAANVANAVAYAAYADASAYAYAYAAGAYTAGDRGRRWSEARDAEHAWRRDRLALYLLGEVRP